MTQTPDPTFHALNQLVVEGRLTPVQAEAAFSAGQPNSQANSQPSRQSGTTPQRVVPAWLKGDVLLVLFGSSLLFAAIGLSTAWTRDLGDIDWSNYLVGLGSTALLLVVAAGSWVLVQDPLRRANLMSWPGALGIVGVGLMIGVGMDGGDASSYVSGGVVLAASAGAYYLIRQSAFVVSAIAGLFIVYFQIFDEVYGADDVDGDNVGIAVGAGVLVFVLLVTVIGWSLPTRDLSAIIVGVFAVFAYTTTMFGLLLVSSIAAAFSGIDQEMGSGGSTMGTEPDNPYTNDVWFLLAFGVLLTVVWAAAWWVRGHDGYRALVLAMLTTLIPAATLALAVEHPSRWGVVVAALGALGIMVAVLRAVGLVGAGSPARG